MPFREEFPDFDHEIPTEWLNEHGFEDVSWVNDVSPSFECDVFILWIDYSDRAKRECANGPQFVMQCEGETYLETDDWADVVAFVVDGRRDFPPYPYREIAA